MQTTETRDKWSLSIEGSHTAGTGSVPGSTGQRARHSRERPICKRISGLGFKHQCSHMVEAFRV